MKDNLLGCFIEDFLFSNRPVNSQPSTVIARVVFNSDLIPKIRHNIHAIAVEFDFIGLSPSHHDFAIAKTKIKLQ